jgi:hypothetical protein
MFGATIEYGVAQVSYPTFPGKKGPLKNVVNSVGESTGNVGVFRVSTGNNHISRFPSPDTWFRVFSWGSVAPTKRFPKP